MPKKVSLLKQLLNDESGQATVEYVMFIAVIAAIIVAVARGLMERMNELIGGSIGAHIQARFFRPENMYSFSLGIRR